MHATPRRSKTRFDSWRGHLTLEPDGKATGCNPVQVGSTPTGVSSEAMMHPGHLRPATGVEDSRQSGHWATPEEPLPPPRASTEVAVKIGGLAMARGGRCRPRTVATWQPGVLLPRRGLAAGLSRQGHCSAMAASLEGACGSAAGFCGLAMVLALVPESPLIGYKSPAGGLGRLVALGRERAVRDRGAVEERLQVACGPADGRSETAAMLVEPARQTGLRRQRCIGRPSEEPGGSAAEVEPVPNRRQPIPPLV